MERARGTVRRAFHPHRGSVKSRRGKPGSSGARGVWTVWWGLSGRPCTIPIFGPGRPCPKDPHHTAACNGKLEGKCINPSSRNTLSSYEVRRSIDERDPTSLLLDPNSSKTNPGIFDFSNALYQGILITLLQYSKMFSHHSSKHPSRFHRAPPLEKMRVGGFLCIAPGPKSLTGLTPFT